MSKTMTTTAAPIRVDINNIAEGDVFSEINHLIARRKTATGYIFTHFESQEEVELSDKYVSTILTTGDQFTDTLIVGKEDKLWTAKQIKEGIKRGDFTLENAPVIDSVRVPGIRTIFENIDSSVFKVKFRKQGELIPESKIEELKTAQINTAIEKLKTQKSRKKSVTTLAEEILRDIQNNPITNVTLGDMRTLRGFKVKFTSRTGLYACVDLEQPAGKGLRMVNINTIEYLISDGIKYVVE